MSVSNDKKTPLFIQCFKNHSEVIFVISKLKWYGDWYSGFLLLTFFFIYVICAYFNYLDRRAFVAKYGLTEGRLLSYIYIIVLLPFVYGQMGAQKDNGAEV